MRASPKIHYVHPLDMQPEATTWCGRSPHNPSTTTVDHLRVTCGSCRKMVSAAYKKQQWKVA